VEEESLKGIISLEVLGINPLKALKQDLKRFGIG
jgi:hypothetical protein